MLGNIAADDDRMAAIGRRATFRRQQAPLDIAEHPGGILQELRHIFLLEHIRRQGALRLLPFLGREERRGLAREGETLVIRLRRVQSAQVQVIEPVAAFGRGAEDRPAQRLCDGRTQRVMPHIHGDGRRLVDHQPVEAVAADVVGIVSREEPDAHRPRSPGELDPHGRPSADPDKITGNGPERLDAALGHIVGRRDPAIVAATLAAAPIEQLGRKAERLAEPAARADGTEPVCPRLMDLHLCRMRLIVQNNFRPVVFMRSPTRLAAFAHERTPKQRTPRVLPHCRCFFLRRPRILPLPHHEHRLDGRCLLLQLLQPRVLPLHNHLLFYCLSPPPCIPWDAA